MSDGQWNDQCDDEEDWQPQPTSTVDPNLTGTQDGQAYPTYWSPYYTNVTAPATAQAYDHVGRQPPTNVSHMGVYQNQDEIDHGFHPLGNRNDAYDPDPGAGQEYLAQVDGHGVYGSSGEPTTEDPNTIASRCVFNSMLAPSAES